MTDNQNPKFDTDIEDKYLELESAIGFMNFIAILVLAGALFWMALQVPIYTNNFIHKYLEEGQGSGI
jgi:hypothetical protein